MRYKTEKINKKLAELGKPLGLNGIDAIKAKRTVKNIITMAIFAGLFMILDSILMPGGPVGLFYTGGSIKDFQLLYGGLM